MPSERARQYWTGRLGTLQEENYCGSSMCFNGYALIGNESFMENFPSGKVDPEWDQTLFQSVFFDNHEGVSKRCYSWTQAGAHHFGITQEEADRLFHMHNTPAKIRLILNEIFEAHGEAVRV